MSEIAVGHDAAQQEHTWGTHFAGTNEPASMVVTPVLASRSINSSFVFIGMDFFSFCSPSRAPTSTMRTWSEVNRDSVAKRRAEYEERRAENKLNLGRAVIMVKFRPICMIRITRIVKEIAGKRESFGNGTVGGRECGERFTTSGLVITPPLLSQSAEKKKWDDTIFDDHQDQWEVQLLNF